MKSNLENHKLKQNLPKSPKKDYHPPKNIVNSAKELHNTKKLFKNKENDNSIKTIDLYKFKKENLLKDKPDKIKLKNNINLFYPEKYIQNGGNYEELNNYYSSSNKKSNKYKSENNDNKDRKCKSSKGKKAINKINKNLYNFNHTLDYSIKRKNNNLIIFAKIKRIKQNNKTNIFNEPNNFNIYYNQKNYMLEKNCIYNAIKNLEKYKIEKKGWSINKRRKQSQDNIRTTNYLKNKILNENNGINNNNKTNKSNKSNLNSKTARQHKISSKNNKGKIEKGDKMQQKRNIKLENGLILTEKTNNVNSIVKNIFNNMNKNDKKLNQRKNNYNDGFYTLRLDKSKNNNDFINNILFRKNEYSNKCKNYFEYQNQMK